MYLLNRFLGDQCQDHLPAAEAEECDPEDSPSDQLQVRWRALGSGDPSGKYWSVESSRSACTVGMCMSIDALILVCVCPLMHSCLNYSYVHSTNQ